MMIEKKVDVFLLIFVGLIWQSNAYYFFEFHESVYGSCSKNDTKLFYSNYGNIYQIDNGHTYLNNVNVRGEPLFQNSAFGVQIIALTYNQLKDVFYFVENRYPQRIYSYNVSSHKLDYFDQNKDDFKELAVDLMTGNIYFISKNNDIGLCDFGHKECIKVIENPSIKHNAQYRNLALHVDGMMFWIESEGSKAGTLWTAYMDGNEAKKFDEFERVSSIAFNPSSYFMFIATDSKIVKYMFDSMSHEKIADLHSATLFYFDCALLAIQKSEYKYTIYDVLFGTKLDEGLMSIDPNRLFVAPFTELGFKVWGLYDSCKLMNCEGMCLRAKISKNGFTTQCIGDEYFLIKMLGLSILAFLSIIGIAIGIKACRAKKWNFPNNHQNSKFTEISSTTGK